MSVLQVTIGTLAVLAVAVFGGVWALQTYGIYRFDPHPGVPAAFGLPETVRIASYMSEDGAPIHAWIADPVPSRPVILALYGNQSSIGGSMGRILPLIDAGYGIVMMEYRGSGATAGTPSEKNFARDARALYDQMDTLIGRTVPPQERVVYGFSLGTGVGSRLAAERPFGAAIFEAAPYRNCLYLEDHYFGLPLCRLMWAERYDIVDHVQHIKAPKLFIHGTLDQALPVERARQLFMEAPEPKEYVQLEGGGHADLHKHGLFSAIEAFLQQHLQPAD
ncbi:alpha/beta hydrolase [Mycoplana rhizolycopersici]|uniref:Serine aminopeptidase S33 domain-containing protein n=1 Tax=Mycoplana rhizolycopersici TaxID=2746702 RepID=A0ABX2Q9H7_9HYPH|nr:hypothetical protein [Rhizobium rhizolycopersici]NVP53966.1 hypothetical protein [Rhizobium rhizolycopersici]